MQTYPDHVSQALGSGQVVIHRRDQMSQEEVEALLRLKYECGEADTGLYNTGLQFVVMDVVDGEVVFQWFADVRDIANLI